MEHIIKKQSVHLVLNRKLDAFRIQQQVSERYWNDVLPALEQLFDEITTEDETLYVAQLEVNLGTLTEGEVSRTTWSDDVLGPSQSKCGNSSRRHPVPGLLRRPRRTR